MAEPPNRNKIDAIGSGVTIGVFNCAVITSSPFSEVFLQPVNKIVAEMIKIVKIRFFLTLTSIFRYYRKIR